MKKKIVLALFLLIPAASSWAGSIADEALNSMSLTTQQDTLLQLASNDTSSTARRSDNTTQGHSSVFNEEMYKEPLFSANKFHKYMGIGAVIMGGVTALSAPDNENEGTIDKQNTNTDFHETSAYIATSMAVLATASGFLFHFDDLSLTNGITDIDNLHMALGLLGTIGYIRAVATSPDDGGDGGSHSTAGILGGASMLLAIKLEW